MFPRRYISSDLAREKKIFSFASALITDKKHNPDNEISLNSKAIYHVLTKHCVRSSVPPDIEWPWTSLSDHPDDTYWLRVTYTGSCDWAKDLCSNEGKISSFRNCLQTAPYTARRSILSLFSLIRRPIKSKQIGRAPIVGRPRLFGGKLLDYIQVTEQAIPLIISSCVSVINRLGLHNQVCNFIIKISN
jgi:hypothetical protein